MSVLQQFTTEEWIQVPFAPALEVSDAGRVRVRESQLLVEPEQVGEELMVRLPVPIPLSHLVALSWQPFLTQKPLPVRFAIEAEQPGVYAADNFVVVDLEHQDITEE